MADRVSDSTANPISMTFYIVWLDQYL